jgi:hypothetical protein
MITYDTVLAIRPSHQKASCRPCQHPVRGKFDVLSWAAQLTEAFDVCRECNRFSLLTGLPSLLC